jgi:hypothetical protein
VRAILLPARAAAGDRDPVPQLGAVNAPTWAVVAETGEPMMPPKPAAAFAQVVKNLQSWAAFRVKLGIANTASTLHQDVVLEVLRRKDGEWAVIEPENSGGLRVVNVGDVIEIRVTNRGTQPLFIGLFDFRPSGSVQRLFPRGGYEPLAAGQPVLLGGGKGFRASWPSEFPFRENPFGTPPDQALETLKAFITTEPTDYAFFEQESASRALGTDSTSSHPLHQLLLAATWGSSRDLAPMPADDWATTAVSFVLRPTPAPTS